MPTPEVLTVEIKLNGRIVAEAELTNRSGLAPVSDYGLRWVEYGDDGLGIAADKGRTVIEHHRRVQGAWSLATKACLAILRHKLAAAGVDP